MTTSRRPLPAPFSTGRAVSRGRQAFRVKSGELAFCIKTRNAIVFGGLCIRKHGFWVAPRFPPVRENHGRHGNAQIILDYGKENTLIKVATI